MEHANSDAAEVRRLLHRWFVQYNPFYLVSAMLCVAGLRLVARGLALRGTVLADLAVGGITELYALALIAGAALLTRIGQRRPAVMLALLAAVYQCDLALHTEDCTYLGAAGVAAGVVWAGLFVAKLFALAWALRLRPSRSALALATYGGVGLAVVPAVISRMDGDPKSSIAVFWVFSVVALGCNVSRRIESAVPLDAWGRTVLRRALGATWLLWALAIALHAYFWSMTLGVRLDAFVPAALLLATRWIRRESRVWAAVLATLGAVAFAAPDLFSVSAMMAAATLGLRAFRHPQQTVATTPPANDVPFRGGASDPGLAAAAARSVWVLAPAPAVARRRLLVGALFATYLAGWTAHWSGGPWPMHALWLDLVLTALVLVAAARWRARIALVPLAVTYAHLAIQTGTVTAPDTVLEWGLLFTAVSFGLLVASLAASYWLRDVQPLGNLPEPEGVRPEG